MYFVVGDILSSQALLEVEALGCIDYAQSPYGDQESYRAQLDLPSDAAVVILPPDCDSGIVTKVFRDPSTTQVDSEAAQSP